MVKSVNPNVGIKGMDIVLSNLNKEIVKMKAGAGVGLIEAAILIRRDMDKSFPKIPIDLGNLRASWFTVTGYGVGAGSRGGTAGTFTGKDAGKHSAERASAVSEGRGVASAYKGLMLMMGFSANYATFVHENVGAKFFGRGGKKPGRPGSGAKFFEASLKKNKQAILQIIGNNARIK